MKSSALLIVAASLIFILSGCHDRKSGLHDGYYIDGIKGEDTNRGDAENPVRTLARINELLGFRLNNVYIAGGQVYEGTLIIKDKEAVPGNPVSVSSTGRGRAVINGGNGEAVRIENCRNIRVTNIDIKGNGRKTGNTTNGFALVRSSDCSIEYLKAEGFQKSGVDLYDCRNCEVKNVLAADNGFCGINIMGSSYETSGKILVQDCMAENNAGDPTIPDNHSGNGILVGVSDSVIIDRCKATNNGWDMPRLGNGPVGIWAWQSDHIIIQYCISYNDAHTTEGAGSIFIWNGSNEKSQLTDCRIHNNIVFSLKAPAISFENASLHEDFVFRRNIFIYAGSRFSGVNSGSSFLNNIWLNTGMNDTTRKKTIPGAFIK